MVGIEDFMNAISIERVNKLRTNFHRSFEPLLSTLYGARHGRAVSSVCNTDSGVKP
jgi:hypothetical protein